MRRHIESNEQRDGRGVRQGNQVYGPVLDSAGAVVDPGAGIRIFVYMTARSFDGCVFQAIEAKARGFRPRFGLELLINLEDSQQVQPLPSVRDDPWLVSHSYTTEFTR